VIYDPWLVKNPFVVDPPVVDKKDRGQASSSDFIIPVTGGLTEISCESESVTLFVDQMQVTFDSLCGYEVAFDILTNETLPGPLNLNDKFLFGLSIYLYKDGTFVSELPAGANVTISYPMAGRAVKWNPAISEWQEIQRTEVPGSVRVDAASGTYILIEN
jgi:hypothetical protein